MAHPRRWVSSVEHTAVVTMLMTLGEPYNEVDHHCCKNSSTENGGSVSVKVDVAALSLSNFERTDDKDDTRVGDANERNDGEERTGYQAVTVTG